MKKRAVLVTFALFGAVTAFFWPPARQETPAEPKEPDPGEAEPAATRNPASAAAPYKPKPLPKGSAAVLMELTVTKACYERDDCDYPQTDPRSYSFAVGHRLASLLEELRVEYSQDASLEVALEKEAQELMKVQDGFVQEEAIKAFSALPPSRQNVEAMISGLQNSPDPLLIEQAMKEWERYKGTQEEAMIQEFLAEFIAHGGQFASEKASEQVLSFLDERSVPIFRAALASMEPGSTPAKNLRAALDEYDRQRMGG